MSGTQTLRTPPAASVARDEVPGEFPHADQRVDAVRVSAL